MDSGCTLGVENQRVGEHTVQYETVVGKRQLVEEEVEVKPVEDNEMDY